MKYIKKEFKKLGSMSLIIVGVFLLLEHIYTYGGIDLWDILGHEWMGILLIFLGVLAANRWGRFTLKDSIKYTKEKLGYFFK